MRISFKYKSATGWISMVENHLGFVNSVYSHERNRGHATGLMENIVTYADEHQILLLLTAQAYSSGQSLDNRQLVDFYSRFGFVRETDQPYWPARMRREPREKNTAHNET